MVAGAQRDPWAAARWSAAYLPSSLSYHHVAETAR